MLFDHGCDAINATVLSIPIGAALSSGWTLKIFFGLWCGYVPFYFQTWEEHHMGAMVLPLINGPSEGLVIAMGLCVISYMRGPDWWQRPVLASPAASPFQLLLGTAIVGALITVTLQSRRVLLHETGPLRRALAEILVFVLMFASSLGYCAASSVALQELPLYAVTLIGSVFVELVTHIMFAHLRGVQIAPLQRHVSPRTPSPPRAHLLYVAGAASARSHRTGALPLSL